MSELCTPAAASSTIDPVATSDENYPAASSLVKTLTQQDERRLTKLNAALEAVLRANKPTSALIKKALTSEQYNTWKADLLAPESADELLTQEEVPAALHDYGRKVAKADFLFGKAEKMAAMKQLRGYQFRSQNITNAYQAAQTAYEQALERLQEILCKETNAQDLRIWLDRDVSFEFDTDLSPEQHGVPRLRTSKSPYVLLPLVKTDKRRKRDLVTLKALTEATKEVIYEAQTHQFGTTSTVNSSNLKDLLTKLKATSS